MGWKIRFTDVSGLRVITFFILSLDTTERINESEINIWI